MTQDQKLQNLLAVISARFSVASSSQLSGMIDRGIREIGEALEIDQAAIYLLVNGDQQLACDRAWCGDEAEKPARLPSALSVADLPRLFEAIVSGEAYSVPRVSALSTGAEGEKRLLRACAIGSLIAVPMYCEKVLVGVFAMYSVHAELPYRKQDVELLKRLAEIFAHTLRRKQTDDALRELALGTTKVSGNDLFEELATQLASVLNARRVLIASHVGASARVLALWVDGELKDVFDYAIRDTHFLKLNLKESISVQACVLGETMKRERAAATSAERYASTPVQDKCLTLPLLDTTDLPIGHICVHGAPLCSLPSTQAVIRAFADRAAEELRRERSEFELRAHAAALNAAADSIVITEPDGTIRWANPAFFLLTGYPETEILGKNMRILKSGSQSETFYQGLWKTIASGRVWHGELRNRRKNGELYDESMTVTPVKNSSGEIVNYIAIKQDASARKRREREHDRLKAQMRQSEKMEALGHLAGGIAHDFNNILASVMGYSDLARYRFGGEDTGKLDEYLGEIYRAGERARDLVSQLLTFSRGGSTAPRPLQLESMVKEIIKMLQSTLPSSIRLTFERSPGLPAVMMSPSQLDQVVMNLCINARDAISGTGEIDVQLNSVVADGLSCRSCGELIRGDFLELMVRDSGAGIPQYKGGKIFDPFFTSKKMGTGMGLSVVHGIVHGCGGHILVESRPGSGSVFRVLLPGVAQESEHAKEDWVLGQQTALEGHVLVVEDEQSVLQYIEEVLKGAGCRVTALTDSQRALALFEEQPSEFDLVVTDQTMPELTGRDLALAVLAARPDLPVVLCTGYSDQIDEQEAEILGITAFLRKPVETEILLNTVGWLLNKHSDTAAS